VELSVDDAWRVLDAAHTGIFTTLRADGTPVSLPVWFVVLDRTICMSTPSATKKLARVQHDPRAGFLVESGERWADLQAVHLNGTVELIDDEPTCGRVAEALDQKYAPFRTDRTAMPASAQKRYAARTFLRLVPDDHPLLSWDNRRLMEEASS